MPDTDYSLCTHFLCYRKQWKIIDDNVYTLVTKDNKDTFKTNGTIDFIREYTYVNDDLTNIKTAGMTTSFDYNADELISVLENTLNDVSKIYGYTYDDNGNITSETVTTKDADGNVVTTETIVYTYDDNKQLISAETSTIKYEYIYDDRGNILAEKEYAVMVDENGEKVYTLIETNTDTYVYDETWKDKLISYNGQSITYDAVGNPTNYMGNALTWTMGRQLASFGNISYTYNEDSIRTSKTSNGVTTKFYLDGTNIIEQTDGTTTLHFFYDSNGEVVGFKYKNNDYIYVKNSMRDIVGIADIDGNLIASYTYDAWGKVTSITGSNTTIGETNPFRYRSYYYDNDTQLYYLNSRYYDATTGRFINSDNVYYIGITTSEISYNPFAYCENNPINNCDPSGLIAMSTCIIIGIIAGALVGGTVGGVISYKKYKTVSWKYIFIGAVAGAAIGGASGYAIGLAISASATTASTAKAFSTTFKITNKISKQMPKRGWTNSLIKSTIKNNVGRKAVNKATGNAATAYFTKSGAYVVIDNITKEIVQISNINDPNWRLDETIKLLRNDVLIK